MPGGQQITSSQGSVTAEGGDGITLTGGASTTAAGNAAAGLIMSLRSRKVGGGAASRALTGASFTTSQQPIAALLSKTPVGASNTFSQGAFTKSRTVQQVGTLLTASQGAATVNSGNPADITTFTLTSSVGGLTLPFSIGHVFRQGDVPDGMPIGGDTSLQVTIKNKWPDNSAKFAVISGRKTLTAGVVSTVTLRTNGTVTGGSALTTADLKTAMSGQTCSIACGAFGAVSWATTDFDSPFQSWVSGPEMSSWVYRKQVGSDTHLVGWIEVRLFAGGSVEVLPWVENGYLRVTGPTNKSATYSFTLGSTQRFSAAVNLLHHQRLVLVSGTILSHWLGADPGTTVRHNAAYMMSTEMVPTYQAVVPSTASRVTSQPTSYTPLMQGSWSYGSDNMAGTGYQEPIGLLPEHEVLYLTADTASSATVYRSVIWNGYGAGRYALHYRDEATNRPPLMTETTNNRPTLVIGDGGSSTNTFTPTPTGGEAPNWDTAHHPSVGYVPYLVTGRFFFMELAAFAATRNHYACSSPERNNGSGWVRAVPGGVQTRASAWKLRTLATAYTIIPDSDSSLKTDFKTILQNNIDHYHSTYAGQTANVFGVVDQGSPFYGPGANSFGWVPFWQEDFVTASWGFALALDPPLDSGYKTKMQQFFAWKAKGIVARTNVNAGGWWYINAAVYEGHISTSTNPDYVGGTGPFLPIATGYSDTVSELVAAGFGATIGSVEGTMGGTWGGGEEWPQAGQPGTWHNMQPAISYAVRHGVPGAKAGYERMTFSSNWSGITTVFNAKPVWSVAPPTRAKPAWLTGGVGVWSQISGTTVSQYLKDYCGVAWIEESNSLRPVAAAFGGHGGNLTDNSVVTIELDTAAPTWSTLRAADSAVGYDTTGLTSPYLPNGKPAPSHTYTNTWYEPLLNRVMVGGRFYGSSAADWSVLNGFRLSDNDWDAAGTFADRPTGGPYCDALDPRTGIRYGTDGYKWVPATTTSGSGYVAFNLSGAASVGRMTCAFDTRRNYIYHLSTGNGTSYSGSFTVNSCRIDPSTGAKTAISFNSSTAWTDFQANADLFVTSFMVYDRDSDCYYFYNGGGEGTQKVYKITPNATTTWDMSLVSVSGVTPGDSINSTNRGGVNSKFYYVSRWRTLILLVPDANIYYLRVA